VQLDVHVGVRQQRLQRLYIYMYMYIYVYIYEVYMYIYMYVYIHTYIYYSITYMRSRLLRAGETETGLSVGLNT